VLVPLCGKSLDLRWLADLTGWRADNIEIFGSDFFFSE